MKKIHLFSGISEEDAKAIGIEPEQTRFAAALGVEENRITVHNLLNITSGRKAIPVIQKGSWSIIGGSPKGIHESTFDQVNHEARLVHLLLARSSRVLAVCYGWQMLARALRTQRAIGVASPAKIGFAKIDIISSHFVVNGLPFQLDVSTFHRDAVVQAPTGMQILAQDRSGIQIAVGRIGETHVLGTQFHPEILTRDPRGLLARLPSYEAAGAQVNLDPPEEIHGPTIIRRFFVS